MVVAGRLVVAVGGLAAAVLAVVLVATSGPGPYELLGYGQPDTGTVAATYLLRLVVDLASAVCVGGLAYAAFCTPFAEGALSPRGWAAARTAGAAAWVWGVAALVLVPFDAADSIGLPVGAILAPDRLFTAIGSLYEPPFWIASALVALAVAVGARALLRWSATVGLLGFAVVGVLAQVAGGRTAGGPDHDVAMSALAVHVVGAALWLGVLVAMLRDERADLGRYRRLAAWCWAALAVSGLVTALVEVPLDQLGGTTYGLLVLVNVAVVLVVGALGIAGRRWAGGRRRRLAAVELAVLVATVGVTMGFTQRPPPAWFVRELSPMEVAMGYALPGAPTVGALLGTWRIDVLVAAGAVTAAVLYLLAVRRLAEPWPPGRTLAWLAGCVLLVVGTSSGVGAYAPAVFSAHMAMHMTLNMVAPLLLVLGGPVTLALRALRPAPESALPGPREWLVALTVSRAARVLAQPWLAALLFAGSFYLLYLTDLFEATVGEHWSRMVMNAVVLAIGYQFCWIVVGVDSGPRQLPHLGRLGIAFAVMPFHAVFAVILMSRSTVIGEGYYRELGPAWAPDLLADQVAGGVISLVMGEAVLIAAQVVLLVQWYRTDPGLRFDRDGDEEAAAYREMLAELRRSRHS